MKHFVRGWFVGIAIAGLLVAAVPAAASQAVPVLPLPAQVVPGTGEFKVDARTPLRIDAGDEAARAAAQYFVERLQTSRGLRLKIETTARNNQPAIRFAIDAAAPAGNEAYALAITPAGVEVRARNAAGLFYGGITLWQLLSADDARGNPVRVPAQRIEDAPRFGWRGFMLDSARHLQSVDEIKRLLDQMAQAKLNVFHWHLTDDQGWRLEIKRYPKLTEVGAWRIPAGKAGRDANGKPLRYGGFYTQAQAREIVEYAAQRHIRVVPEIEMPGHAQAAIAAYPQFGVTGKTPAVSPDWGVNPYLYNIDDATFGFLENVLTEVMGIFPGTYIHIGGDEAVKLQWRGSPQVQARMRELGLKDEAQLQSWFIKRIERFLVGKGRKLIGWDEILEGGLPEEATVMSWRGTKGAVEAAREGHDVVLTPSDLTYLNRLQSLEADEPPAHDHLTTLRAVYDFEPVPVELNEAQAKHVLGTQANLWTEHVRTEARVEHMAFPRLAALAESAWTPRAKKDWSSFLQRLAPQMQRYRQAGIRVADSAFAARIRTEAKGRDRASVRLENQTGFGELRYTLDGSAPTSTSSLYRDAFDVALPTTLRANAFFDGKPLAAMREARISADSLRTIDVEALHSCTKDDWLLRLEDDEPAGDNRAVVAVNIGNTCRIWKQADLSGIAALRVDALDLPFNFQFGEDSPPGKLTPQAGPHGELQVLRDGCEGALIGSISMADARRRDGVAIVDVPLQPSSGRHDLCLRFTRDKRDPFWAFDRAQLLPERE